MGNCKSKVVKPRFVNNINKHKLTKSIQLKINEFNNIYYTTAQIKLNYKFILRENSIIKLFEGNTYGLVGFNDKPIQLIIIDKKKNIMVSQNWYSIHKKNLKPFINKF